MQPPKEYEGSLVAKQKLTENLSLFTIQIKDPTFSFIAGQFMMLSVTQDRGLARAFSICSGPEKKSDLEFCMKINYPSVLSEKLEQAPLKTKVYVKGPFGAFKLKPITQDIVLIAGGTGIAPLRSMLQELVRQKVEMHIWCFYRFKNEEEYLFKEELESIMKKNKKFHLIPSVSTPKPTWKGETERIQNIIAKYIKDPNVVDCYICGPPQMVKDLIEALPRLGFSEEAIHKEAW
ncbi:FAD-dependent oxidoreductase [Candidatus Woesearchaeota archaeon]|nr:FAD-dependent oxidoreductase [Candidatus Woesearchaeota archaeon]